MFDNFIHKLLSIWGLLSFGDKKFDHAKAMIIHRELKETVVDFLKNKLPLALGEASDKHLDHMGALDILKELFDHQYSGVDTYQWKICHMSVEHPGEEFNLLF